MAQKVIEYLETTLEETQEALEGLLSVGAICDVPEGYRTTKKSYSFFATADANTLNRTYIHYLNKVISRIEEEDEIACDFNGFTLAIPEEKFDEAKRRIEEFSLSLASWLREDGFDKTAVYRLSTQFFPVSKKVGKTNE